MSTANVFPDIVAMASSGLEKELNCCICLSLYTDPATLRCGHNFCLDCIDQMLNAQERSGGYSCPECREEFQIRPIVKRNVTLCKVVENFRSNHRNEASILCTYCVDSPLPAVMSCLMCEASLCDKHLMDHIKEPEHVLNYPSTSLENRKCPVHKKILEYYCTEDATSICVSCSLAGEHRGHRVEELDEASEKRKKQKLSNVQLKLMRSRKNLEERIRRMEALSRKAKDIVAGEVRRVTAQFIDVRGLVEDLEKRILNELSRREEKVSLSHVIRKMEIKKDELSRKIRHIEELCNMMDPLTVLQKLDIGDLCDPKEEGGDEDTGGHDGDLSVAMIFHISKILCDMLKGVNVIFYMQDPADILLDVKTAQNNLIISEDLKTATWTAIPRYLPVTGLRFQGFQVMSGRGFTSGRHYWDVEIRRSRNWRVGMCYPSIARSGLFSFIGYGNKSWRLGGERIFSNRYTVRHDNYEITLPYLISSDRVRIYLDYEAGQLSFYELCDPIRHLHTFTATFSEPLHPALFVYDGSVTISGRSRR